MTDELKDKKTNNDDLENKDNKTKESVVSKAETIVQDSNTDD